jgi:hypothetical protein
VEVLRRDNEVVLGNLDKFSLLPNEFEFTIKIDDGEISSAFRVREINEINDNLEAGEMAVSLSQIMRQNDIINAQLGSDEMLHGPEDLHNHAVSSTTVTTTTSISGRKRSLDESPNDENSDAKKTKPSSPNTNNTEEIAQPSSTSEEQNKPEPESSSSAEQLTPKIKPDPDSTDATNQNLPSTSSSNQPASASAVVKSEPSDAVKTEPSTADTNTSPTCQSNQNPTPAPAGTRPSCEFGIRCYRMTDDHRLAFAHPMDNDYRRPAFPPADIGGK